MSWRTTLLGAVLGGMVLLGGASAAQARDNCENRIRKEQRDLDRAIRKHGFYSRQANEERQELRRAQARCGFFDHGDRRWRRRDRDRDHDRDRDDR